MTSKAEQRRRKKARNTTQPHQGGEISPTRGASRPKADKTTAKPTPERYRRGKWAEGKGQMVDIAHDMIGRLGVEGKLSPSQVEAARVFQEVHTNYVSDLDIGGYRSCLAGGSGGFDGGDGNPEYAKAYNQMIGRIGRIATACLKIEVYKLDGERPIDLAVLRNSLNVLANG